jgi:hypothetical protein
LWSWINNSICLIYSIWYNCSWLIGTLLLTFIITHTFILSINSSIIIYIVTILIRVILWVPKQCFIIKHLIPIISYIFTISHIWIKFYLTIFIQLVILIIVWCNLTCLLRFYLYCFLRYRSTMSNRYLFILNIDIFFLYLIWRHKRHNIIHFLIILAIIWFNYTCRLLRFLVYNLIVLFFLVYYLLTWFCYLLH